MNVVDIDVDMGIVDVFLDEMEEILRFDKEKYNDAPLQMLGSTKSSPQYFEWNVEEGGNNVKEVDLENTSGEA